MPTNADDKNLRLQNFQKYVSSIVYHIENSETKDLDEAAHHEPSHQALYSLKNQLFPSLGPVVQNQRRRQLTVR